MEKENMKKLVSLMSVLLLVGCGSGGSAGGLTIVPVDTGSTTPVYTSVNNFNIHEHVNKITVIDGYVEGANVYVDLNFNGVQDEDEQSAFFTGVTDSFTQCIMADENGCTETIVVDPPDNYYWFLGQETVDQYETDKSNGYYGDNPPAPWWETYNVTPWNAGITNQCHYGKKLIRAEVPVGAYDSERGYVETAYEMAYIPYYEQGGYRPDVDFNITPFLSLLEYFISGLNIQDIPYSESCDTYANDIMSLLISRLEGVMNELKDSFDIDPIYFYEDFLLTGDTDTQILAEKIVDFLATSEALKALVQTSVASPVNQYLGEGMINTVLTNPSFTSLETDISYEEDGSITVGDFQQIKRFYFHNITIDGSGNILDRNNQTMSMTLDNVSQSADFYEESLNLFAENYIDNDIDVTLKDSTMQDYDSEGELRITESKFVLFSDRETNSQFDRQVSLTDTGKEIRIRDWYTDQPTISTVLEINNPSNNLVNYDIQSIVLNGDLNTSLDVYSELSALPKGIDNVNTLQGYLYSGDELQVEKIDTNYTYVYGYTTSGEYCLTLDNATRNQVSYNSGSNALTTCLELMGE